MAKHTLTQDPKKITLAKDTRVFPLENIVNPPKPVNPALLAELFHYWAILGTYGDYAVTLLTVPSERLMRGMWPEISRLSAHLPVSKRPWSDEEYERRIEASAAMMAAFLDRKAAQ